MSKNSFQKCGKYPPVHPNGWFKIMDSHLLKRGEVKYASCLGKHFAVFRGEDGTAAVIDAFCPHLGANIGLGGIVKGNCLECPFHGWQFDAQGTCTKIPYAKSIPHFAKIKSYPTLEYNGLIMLWYDAEGREPQWKPRYIDNLMNENSKWRFHGKTVHHINAHIQEIPENGADSAHLNVLHTLSAWSRLLKHHWTGIWKADTTEGQQHLAHIRVTEWVDFFGFRVPFSYQEANITQEGPGLVYLDFHTIFGDVVIIEAITPLGPFHQLAEHTIISREWVPRFVCKIMLVAMSQQFEKDVPIWNNKAFINNPLLLKEDGNIAAFRRWYSRFYSANSPTIESLKLNTQLEW